MVVERLSLLNIDHMFRIETHSTASNSIIIEIGIREKMAIELCKSRMLSIEKVSQRSKSYNL